MWRSSWVKRSKMRWRSASGMPGPASSTARMASAPSRIPDSRTGSPSGEYLQALSSRLPRTWTTASSATRTGRAPLVSIAIWRSLWRALASAPAWRTSSAASSSTLAARSEATPSACSKRAVSNSCSIMSCSRSLWWMPIATSSSRSSGLTRSRRTRRIPKTPTIVVSGLRSSWETVAIRSALSRSASWSRRTTSCSWMVSRRWRSAASSASAWSCLARTSALEAR